MVSKYEQIIALIDMFARCMFPEDGKIKRRLVAIIKPKLQAGVKYNGKDFTYLIRKSTSM